MSNYSENRGTVATSAVAHDPVNHPSHYTSGKFEVIDIIQDQLGTEGLRNFCLGNAIKYICRAGKKDASKTIQDLEKAVWYLNHYIQEAKALQEGGVAVDTSHS